MLRASLYDPYSMVFRDNQNALLQRVAMLEGYVARAERLEQRVRELEAENRQLRLEMPRTEIGKESRGAVAGPSSSEIGGDIFVDDKILTYIERIVVATHPTGNGVEVVANDILSGLRPCDSDTLVAAAKGQAKERGYVLPDDVKFVAGDLLRRRIILTRDAEEKGVTVDTVIGILLDHIDVP